jgi:hypothetical protein
VVEPAKALHKTLFELGDDLEGPRYDDQKQNADDDQDDC